MDKKIANTPESVQQVILAYAQAVDGNAELIEEFVKLLMDSYYDVSELIEESLIQTIQKKYNIDFEDDDEPSDPKTWS